MAIASLDFGFARNQGLEIAPLCPFIAHYIKRHPEYEELVTSRYRDR